MQQLFAAFGIDWRLLIIQGINFGVLLAALWYFLYGPITKMIDERREKIAEGIRQAEAAERNLQAAKEEGEGIIGSAAREAEALSQSARMRADERGAEIVRAAEEKAQAVMKDASARAEEAQRQAMLSSQKEIARAAMLAAEKILREKTA